MTNTYSCNTGTIAPYVPTPLNPWDAQKIKHLYRRLDYGASITQIKAALSKTPSQLVDEIIDQAIGATITPAPEWAFWTDDDYNAVTEEQLNDLKDIRKFEGYDIAAKDLLKNGLMGRLTFFWLNHFVTIYGEYNCPAYLYQYYVMLQKHALGNFKEFTREIGLTPAMLRFLNNFENTKNRPNENYARELFELFTLGENNGYTQEDIEESSRAMTGYNERNEKCGPISFDPEKFDSGNKTIFGKTASYDYNGIIDLLFEERMDLIAEFICAKLYTYFVNPEQDAGIIVQMKKTFLASNFEIEPVLRQLFKSEHFFDVNTHGIVIKSPYDVAIQFLKETGFTFDDKLIENLKFNMGILGQDFFQPVDVAGWERNRKWLNTSTLPARWFIMEDTVLQWTWSEDTVDDTGNGVFKEQYRALAIALAGGLTDINAITKAIVDFFMAKELNTQMDYAIATDIFMGEIPENYFSNGIWSFQSETVPDQMKDLLRHIIEMPEFQLK